MSHLLSVNSYHYERGGADALYFSHAALMERHGWKNSFFSMHHKENIPCVDSEYFADEIDYQNKVSLGRKLVDASRVVYSFEAKNKISKLLDSRKIDVAHIHSVYHHQSPSILVELKERGIPTVLTAHDLKLACPAYKMLNSSGICERCKGGKVWNVAVHRCIKDSLPASALIMVESGFQKATRLYARNLDWIIAPSKFYRDKLIEWGWDPASLIHIPNFVPANSGADRVKQGDYILYFGRLSNEKGLKTLIKAAAKSGVPVKVAGRGPEELALREMVTQTGAPVEFLGFKSGDLLWDAVDKARAVVLPSEWYENGPLSVIEAFGRGKPLVGARIGGIPELISEGETGWSFASGDVDDLATSLGIAWNTTNAELQVMADACRQFVRDHHTEGAYYHAISRLYSGIVR